MYYLSLFCLNLLYKSLDVYNSGRGVVPNSDVYKYSAPRRLLFSQPNKKDYDVAVGQQEGNGPLDSRAKVMI